MSTVDMQAIAFAPDYVVPPGDTLSEALEERGMTQAELARRMGRPRKTINGIVHGEVQITPETAIEFERVLGIPAQFWLNLERNYRIDLARISEAQRLSTKVDWLKRFPIKEMISRGWITAHDSISQLHQLLSFLGCAYPELWEDLWREERYLFRMASTFQQRNEDYSLSIWLRQGERQSQDILCQPFNETRFKEALGTLRPATRLPPEQSLKMMVEQCATAGVAVVFVPELKQTHICGATYWVSPAKAVIQLSLRYKTSDSLWFTFYHEAGHIVRHKKTEIFLDDQEDASDYEVQADLFARDMLIPPTSWRQFKQLRQFKAADIQSFADAQQIGPDIIIGRLRHEKVLSGPIHSKMMVSLNEWLAQMQGNDSMMEGVK